MIQETPDLYIIGNQRKLQTKMVEGEADERGKKKCKIVLVPGFAETGVLALVNLRTLGVKSVQFAVKGMTGGAMSNGIEEEGS